VKHRFRSMIEQARGPGAAVAIVPADVATALGGLKQQRVVGALNGAPFKTSTFPWHGRELYVGVPKAARDATLDKSPRVVVLAPALRKALESHPALKKRFDGLSFSRRRALAEPVAAARNPRRARRD
jgi:Domain of unknown function (DUF1905)/Bacteriocin-protection, YdeI or OmpD-Associated